MLSQCVKQTLFLLTFPAGRSTAKLRIYDCHQQLIQHVAEVENSFTDKARDIDIKQKKFFVFHSVDPQKIILRRKSVKKQNSGSPVIKLQSPQNDFFRFRSSESVSDAQQEVKRSGQQALAPGSPKVYQQSQCRDADREPEL